MKQASETMGCLKAGLQSRLKKHRYELFMKAGRSTSMHLRSCVKSLKRR